MATVTELQQRQTMGVVSMERGVKNRMTLGIWIAT
jgi:hypothetical protein